MIVVEATILVFRPLAGVSLQLPRECPGLFILDQHQDALYNHPYVSQRWLRALVFSPGRLSLRLFRRFLTNEPLQLSLPNESLYLLL